MEVIQAIMPPQERANGIDKFGRIGVLMGGPSTEREISLKSGQAVCESLNQQGIEHVAIDIISDNTEDTIQLIKAHKINCAFLALHGRFGEDGGIQKILDALQVPYTGSSESASRLAMDKVASRKIFKECGLDVPISMIIERSSRMSFSVEALTNFKFPFVVKPVMQGSSVGLSIVDKKEDLNKAIELAFSLDERVLIEEYIRGREVTIGILDEKPLPVIEIIPKKRFFDYEAKYQSGMTEYRVPAQLEKEIISMLKEKAYLAHKVLGCFGCSRVDMILDKDNNPFILEVNTIPGLTQTSLLPKAAKAAGIDFSQLCITLIQLAYAKARVQ